MNTTAQCPARVLVVEDEPAICDALALRLRAEGFEVFQAFDGPSAVASDAENDPDLIVLDLMLPGFDGLEVCRRVQARRPVPILMLTARTDESDILAGFAVGADDYVPKPFSVKEVVARVHALLRRVERARELAQGEPATIAVGDLTIDTGTRRVVASGDEVRLTPLEFDLLVALASPAGRVHTRDQLMQQVWGWGEAAGSRTLDSHVKALRAKVGRERVRTVHGVGFALEES